jgi:thymidine phosphorylase
MTLPQEIIRAKRDGRALSEGEIDEFIAGLTSGAVGEGQAAAFAMAVFFRGMTLDERLALTRAMTMSGAKLDWRESNLSGPALDKHSTGGVGDNVSVMLAPMLAASGAYVPMISGRGLGHTGGTLDKLDSIPGYVSQPDLSLFKRVVKEAGCAIIGQTADLAPADRRLYAIRDVTATVESIALITASILSKKLAAGLQGLVMDVKTGTGAFMPTPASSRELAASIASVASAAGLPTVSLITDMNEPLASAAGNAVEIHNAVDYLTGARRDQRLHRVTLMLGAELLALSGLAKDVEEGAAALERSLASGAAAERFERMVAALGGPKNFLMRAHALLPRAPILIDAMPASRGFVTGVDVREIGLAVVELGGGRARESDSIDPSVGLTELAPLGAEVGPDMPLARVHARDANSAEAAARRLRDAYRLSATRPELADPIVARVSGAAA